MRTHGRDVLCQQSSRVSAVTPGSPLLRRKHCFSTVCSQGQTGVRSSEPSPASRTLWLRRLPGRPTSPARSPSLGTEMGCAVQGGPWGQRLDADHHQAPQLPIRMPGENSKHFLCAFRFRQNGTFPVEGRSIDSLLSSLSQSF